MNNWTIIIWLVANAVSFAAIGYALRDTLKDYRIAPDHWYKTAAKVLIRSHILSLLTVALLFSASALAAAWPNPDIRPPTIVHAIRTVLTLPVVLIAANSLLDVRAKRELLRKRSQ